MIIDFHYHYANIPDYVEALIKSMDHAGVDKTVLLGGSHDHYWDYLDCNFKDNQETLEALKHYPDRLLGGIYIDPREPNAVQVFERFADQGFKLVKMIPTDGYYPDDERFFPVYEKIQVYGLPILFHVGLTNTGYKGIKGKVTSSKYSHPLYLDLLLRLFPNINFVFAHMGYPYFQETWAMAQVNPNVIFDISGSGGAWMRAAPYVYNSLQMAKYCPIDFKRVVWGSDNIMSQQENMKEAWEHMQNMGCLLKDRELIFGETAKKILKI
jgi:predicted TIM-barrel fold metal-dependent hydrolase